MNRPGEPDERYDILSKAMDVLGVHSVAVFSVATGLRVWSTGPSPSALDTDVVTAVVDRVAMAQRLLSRTDPAGALEEVLAMDDACVHVLHLIADRDGGPHIAYLRLDRDVANLALARREFRALLQGEPLGQQSSGSGAPVSSARLPHRIVNSAGTHMTHVDDEQFDRTAPTWLDTIEDPRFAADVHTVHRVLESLRRL